MRSHSAYLLVSHGSRDPRPQKAAERLAQLFCEEIHDVRGINTRDRTLIPTSWHSNSQVLLAVQTSNRVGRLAQNCDRHGFRPLVGTAVLEFGLLALPEQIQQFAQKALTAGYHHVQILPLFLLPGVHVMTDIPTIVASAQHLLGSQIALHLRPYLGSHPRLIRLLVCQTWNRFDNNRILLAHGSRRIGGNAPVEAMAASLGARVAFWATPPSLRSQIEVLIQQGSKQITILPYFLFSGGILDAIVHTVTNFSQQFPETKFTLAPPLAANPDLASLVVDLSL